MSDIVFLPAKVVWPHVGPDPAVHEKLRRPGVAGMTSWSWNRNISAGLSFNCQTAAWVKKLLIRPPHLHHHSCPSRADISDYYRCRHCHISEFITSRYRKSPTSDSFNPLMPLVANMQPNYLNAAGNKFSC